MSQKTFRFTKLSRYYQLITGMIVSGTLIWLVYVVFRSSMFDAANFSIPLILPLLVFSFILLVIVIYTNWAVWSYRIEFWEGELHTNKYGNPFAHKIKCSYDDIIYIRRPIMKGSIEIILNHGKPLQILTARIEGGSDRIVDELEKHVNQEKFQPYLRSELKKFSRYEKITFVTIIPLLLLYVAFFGSQLLARNTAWETVWSPNVLGFGNIDGFWVDNDSVWVSYRQAFSDSSEIVHISGKNKESWSISEDRFYPDVVLADSTNQPWLFGYDGFYHWTGSSWQGSRLQNYTINSRSAPVVINGAYWAVAFQKEINLSYLVEVNLDSGKITPVYLPDPLVRDNFSIRTIKKSPDGFLYVMITKPYGSVFIYSLKNGHWERKIELAGIEWKAPSQLFNDSEPILGVKDFALDTSGQIWIVIEKEKQYLFGRYNSPNNSWEWSQIEAACSLCTKSYDSIVIDTNGRVWLRGQHGHKKNPDDSRGILDGRNIDVFLPQWGDVAEQLTRYTDKNSNYQLGFSGNKLRLSEDGYIWTGNDRVVRIDANRQELPKPLPEWFVKLTSINTILLGISVTGGLYLIWTIIYLIFFKSKDLSKTPTPNS